MKHISKYKQPGWFNESHRHSLAAQGIKSKRTPPCDRGLSPREIWKKYGLQKLMYGPEINYFLKTNYETMQPIAIRETSGIDKNMFMVERKYDGTRITAYIGKDGKVSLLNRRGFNKFNLYPELENEWAKLSSKGDVVLDGELLVMKNYKDIDSNEDFERLSMRDRLGPTNPLIQERSKLYPATFIVFDILELNNKDATATPLTERKKILHSIFSGLSLNHIKYAPEFTFEDIENLRKKGHIEGVILKQKNSPYIGGDNFLWKKLKFLKNNDVVVLGYTKGKGAREEGFGALAIGVWDTDKKKYVYKGTVGGGYDRSEVTSIKSRLKPTPQYEIINTPKSKDITWVKPEMIRRIEFLKTSPYGIYQQPVDTGERTDILPQRTHEVKQ